MYKVVTPRDYCIKSKHMCQPLYGIIPWYNTLILCAVQPKEDMIKIGTTSPLCEQFTRQLFHESGTRRREPEADYFSSWAFYILLPLATHTGLTTWASRWLSFLMRRRPQLRCASSSRRPARVDIYQRFYSGCSTLNNNTLPLGLRQWWPSCS